MQAVAGAAWWIAVFTSPFVRETTLGSLDPVVVAALDIPLFVIASAIAATGVKPVAIVAAAWTVIVALALAGYATVTTEAGWGVLIMAAAAGASVLAVSLMLLGRVPTEWIIAGPFAFRAAAKRETVAPQVIATLGQLVFFWGFFLVVLPLAVTFLERRWQVGIEFPGFAVWPGVVILILASALGLSSAFAMSTIGNGTPLPSAMANTLVVVGPYRWVRNPMAVAGIGQGVAVGLLLSSWLVVVYALLGALVWNLAVRPLEEADLEARFGAEFRRYRDAVRCWLPGRPVPVAGPSSPAR